MSHLQKNTHFDVEVDGRRLNARPLGKMSRMPFMPISEFEYHDVQFAVQKKFSEDAAAVIKESYRKRDFDNSEAYSHYVELLLEAIGMDKYVELFKLEDIGIDLLLQMDSDDLTSIGITDAEDRNCILKHLDGFSVDHHPQYGDQDIDSLDHVVMAKNVLSHIIELNSYTACVHYQLRKSNLEDYFISTHATALGILKLVTKRALTQSKRISKILFDGSFKDDSLIAATLKGEDCVLPDFLRNKLIQGADNKKKLKKERVFFTVAAGVCIIFAILFHTPKKFW